MSGRLIDASVSEGVTASRAWEEELSFQDALFEWMNRAPWLALSATAHAMGLLVLSLIPWTLLEQRELLGAEAARASEVARGDGIGDRLPVSEEGVNFGL